MSGKIKSFLKIPGDSMEDHWEAEDLGDSCLYACSHTKILTNKSHSLTLKRPLKCHWA